MTGHWHHLIPAAIALAAAATVWRAWRDWPRITYRARMRLLRGAATSWMQSHTRGEPR